ncbi:MAG: nucleoside triphosphate pyrophosphohydrolase [Deltaproteobacteria bacterium]|nr:nucleoside triphosphate pyrophosphohydrolase [Deltaproteobacteria bacterium]
MKEFDRLIEIMEKLRGPGGCPWDAKQTHESIMKCLVEEAFELRDAVLQKNANAIKEEMGDVLLQVVFCGIIAKDAGQFDLEDAIGYLCDKLIYRHPHVFGDAVAKDADEVLKNWEKLKEKEDGKSTRDSVFSGLPKSLPALLYALKIQALAARVGFDWADGESVLEKITEETGELKDAMKTGDMAEIEAEIGDLLFTIVNLCRHMKIDPETALQRSNTKFTTRFGQIEKKAKQGKISLSDMENNEMEKIWEAAKAAGL